MKTNQIALVQRLVLLVLVVGIFAIVGVGCRTAHGFGEDMQNAGEGIQRGTR